jgi:hypothetical protein
MSVRYAAVSKTGMNDPTKRLRVIDDEATSWTTFADAKAAVVARAQILRDFLETSRCHYRVQSVSATDRYEVWFEYGPEADEEVLPFRMLLEVHPRSVLGLRAPASRRDR